MGDAPDNISEWIHRHYQDHVRESGARIQDISTEISLTDLDDLASTSLTDPDADKIVFWDDSDSQYEFLTPNTLLSITGNNLNVNVDGLIETWDITALEDDAATSTTPTNAIGVLIIHAVAAAAIAYTALVSYRISATNATAHIAGHADIEVATGVLTGTDANDAKLTVSTDSTTGKVYVENRLGSTLTFRVVFLY